MVAYATNELIPSSEFAKRFGIYLLSAKSGTLKLLPSQEIEKTLRQDYRDMRLMIYGNYPEFDAILETLKKLEDEINK